MTVKEIEKEFDAIVSYMRCVSTIKEKSGDNAMDLGEELHAYHYHGQAVAYVSCANELKLFLDSIIDKMKQEGIK